VQQSWLIGIDGNDARLELTEGKQIADREAWRCGTILGSQARIPGAEQDGAKGAVAFAREKA
jgi:hypothetical protein